MRRLHLAEAQQLYRKQESIMRSIQEELGNALARLREIRRGSLDLDLVAMGEHYLRLQKDLESRQSAVLEEAKAWVLRRQQEFIQVQKERKLLERLYDRLWSAYYGEFLREEQKNLDEVGLVRFFRRQEETV